MTHKFTILIVFILGTVLTNQLFSQDKKVLIKTSVGDVKIKLYEETILHQENFIKLVNEGFYNGVLFHRVIKDFMVQTGDDKSKHASPGQALGTGGKKYTIPAEFFPQFYHKYGALAAARQGDNINPRKESSGSQFYIVTGKVMDDKTLDMFEMKYNHPKFTDEQRNVYKTIGGVPHLDYNYTVFGEVIEGMEVIDKIDLAETDQRNRPQTDIKIIEAKVLK